VPRLTYKEISELVHLLNNERTVLMGAVLQLKTGNAMDRALASKLRRVDGKVRLARDRLYKIIEDHDKEEE